MGSGPRVAVSALGVLVCLAGAIFLLQGVGLIGGSFMSGRASWAVIGALMVAGGAGVLIFGRPRPRR